MLDDLHSLSLLTVMEIVGPVILAVGLVYGIVRSRRSKSARVATNRATRDLYRQERARQSGLRPT
jgi:hypothetical protein